MKRHSSGLIMLVIILFSASKTKCTPLTDIRKTEIEKQILQLWDKMILMVEKIDADACASFLSSDKFIANYSGGSVF